MTIRSLLRICGFALLACLFIYCAGRYSQFSGGWEEIIEEVNQLEPIQIQETAVEDPIPESARASFSFERFATNTNSSNLSAMIQSFAGSEFRLESLSRVILKKLILSFMIGFFMFAILCGYLGYISMPPIMAACMVAFISLLSGVFPLLSLAFSAAQRPSAPTLILYGALVAYLGSLIGSEAAQRLRISHSDTLEIY